MADQGDLSAAESPYVYTGQHQLNQASSKAETYKSYSQFEEETSMQKFKRRLKEEPLIPLGIVNTRTLSKTCLWSEARAGKNLTKALFFLPRLCGNMLRPLPCLSIRQS